MLTPNQQRTLDFIKGYISSNGIAPTIKEIGARIGLKSTSSVYEILVILENMGHIRRKPDVARGIELL